MKYYVKFIFKKLFFRNVLAFIDVFIDNITFTTSSIQITCSFMCVQYVIQ